MAENNSATPVSLPMMDIPRLILSEDADTSKPVPILIKVAKEGETPNVYYAPNAQRFAVHLEWAEQLERANAEHTPEARTHREKVRAARALIEAPTITPDDWKGKWVCDGEETYAGSVDELVEQIIDEGGAIPAYCYTTTSRGFDFDLEDAVESYLMDEHHEDAECFDLPRLLDFFEEWKKTETVKTYWPDKTIVIIDQERFDVAIAEARALIAGAKAPANGSPGA